MVSVTDYYSTVPDYMTSGYIALNGFAVQDLSTRKHVFTFTNIYSDKIGGEDFQFLYGTIVGNDFTLDINNLTINEANTDNNLLILSWTASFSISQVTIQNSHILQPITRVLSGESIVFENAVLVNNTIESSLEKLIQITGESIDFELYNFEISDMSSSPRAISLESGINS